MWIFTKVIWHLIAHNLFTSVQMEKRIIYKTNVDKLWRNRCYINLVKICISGCQLHRPVDLHATLYKTHFPFHRQNTEERKKIRYERVCYFSISIRAEMHAKGFRRRLLYFYFHPNKRRSHAHVFTQDTTSSNRHFRFMFDRSNASNRFLLIPRYEFSWLNTRRLDNTRDTRKGIFQYITIDFSHIYYIIIYRHGVACKSQRALARRNTKKKNGVDIFLYA